MPTFESETFYIDMPDELGLYSAELYKELVAHIPTRQGKLVKFDALAQSRRVINDLCLLAEQDGNSVFVEKVKKSPWRRVYVRPTAESKA